MKNKKGFTLLELLVSLAIISIILIGFFKVINNTIKINNKNDRDIRALNLLQSEIEDIRSQIKLLGNESALHIGNEEVYVNNDGIIPIKPYIKSSGGKAYNIKLNLEKKTSGKNIYLFDIDISAKLIEKDRYFSKKESKLTTSILSKNDIGGNNPPVDPPEVIKVNNYLLYCLNRSANLFKQASKDDLYNMIMVDEVVGNQTLIQMVGQNNIDIINSEQQIHRILENTKNELDSTHNNTQIDFINEANYYCEVAKYTLEFISFDMDEDLSNAHTLAWNKIHGEFIDSYNLEVMNLYNTLWSKGFTQAYNYFFNLLPNQIDLFNRSLAEISNDINAALKNANEDGRKAILDKINSLIDEIIKHQVYDIEKYIRENIRNDYEITNQKNKILNKLEDVNRELVYLKAIIYNSNYYKNN